MCSRIIQSSEPLRLAIVEGLSVSDNRLGKVPRRYNAAPSEKLLVIRENHKTAERSLDLIKWGFDSQLVPGPQWRA
jgi:putative SOS response-associated peptidase YedK